MKKSFSIPARWIEWSRCHWGWIAVGLVILFVGAVRWRLREMPLERDEGEYAYAGQLLLQGVPPYKLAFNLKFPGAYVAYAAIFAVLGQSVAAIHVAIIGVTSASTVLLFLIGRRLLDTLTGVAAAITFALMSTGTTMFGLAGHANHFVVLFTLLGLLGLLREWDGMKKRSAFLIGLVFGIAVLMKQHAAFFAGFVALCLTAQALASRTKKQRALELAVFCAGGAMPLLATAAWFWTVGVFETFWFWTVSYARHYAVLIPLAQAPGTFMTMFSDVSKPFLPLWFIGVAGLMGGIAARRFDFQRWWLTGFAAASFASICPGFVFRENYFLTLLPALALGVGLAVGGGSRWMSNHPTWGAARFLPVSVFAAATLFGLFDQWPVWVELPPGEALRRIYVRNPFAEVATLADYVRQHSEARDQLAVLGSEPQAYFYARRRAATGYLYTYALMEPQPFARRMQEEMIAQIESAKPRFVLLADTDISWLTRPNSDRHIFDWWASYAANRYEIIAVAEAGSEGEPNYFWGDDARTYQRGASAALVLYLLRGDETPAPAPSALLPTAR